MCEHTPSCPDVTAPDAAAARTIVRHDEQGWSLLCNGMIAFDDGGALGTSDPDRTLSLTPRSPEMCR